MGNFIHYMATFVAGFAVGFTSLWKLALVTLAVVPLIAIAGGFYAACLTEHTARTQQQYWEAGSIVEQVPGSSLHIEILDPLYWVSASKIGVVIRYVWFVNLVAKILQSACFQVKCKT